MICVLVEEEWLIKTITAWSRLALFTRYMPTLLSTSAVGIWIQSPEIQAFSNAYMCADMEPKHLCCWLRNVIFSRPLSECQGPQPVSHLLQEGVYDSLVWLGLSSFMSPACHAREFSCLPLPTRMDTLWGNWWLFLPGYYICWMNEMLAMYISTCESKVVPCTEKKHDKYWMNIHIGE